MTRLEAPTRRKAVGYGSAPVGARLRALLYDPEVTLVVGVHDGLSARIAADEGFSVLWASGLCMSTALGLRDSDEVSWTQQLDVVEAMVEATETPILVDGDTGHGNFNTARRFVARAHRIGAAGVCLEDKIFPKMNSFVGAGHPLAPVEEFCGKIRACKDAVGDSDFVVVARVEALIAGRGLAEALERGEAYRMAGADAVFIHSRQRTASEIEAFARAWGRRLPLLVAPTTYYATPIEEFDRMGVAAVIWANHPMRAAVRAMRQTCRTIRSERGVTAIERHIASLAEVFDLMRYSELEADEARYCQAGAEQDPGRGASRP